MTNIYPNCSHKRTCRVDLGTWYGSTNSWKVATLWQDHVSMLEAILAISHPNNAKNITFKKFTFPLQKSTVLGMFEGSHGGPNDIRKYYSGWWFQPIWKILVKLEIFPNFRGENSKKYLSCHHLVLDVYKILRWMMLKNFVFQIIGILEWMGGFVASTHYGSMGRTVYLPTWIVDSCGINVGKYTVTVPWTGSVMGYIMDTYVDPVYRDPSIYKLGMDFLVWISLYWQKITQNPPIYTNSLPNLHSLKLT